MRTIHVAQRHPSADNSNLATADAPLATIQAASELAGPGDTILIHEGIYRERVNPPRGGEEGAPIVYQAAERGKVFLRGSDEVESFWAAVPGSLTLSRLPLTKVEFGATAYRGDFDPDTYGTYQPFHLQYGRVLPARPHAASLIPLQRGFEDFRAKIPGSDGSGTALVNWKEKLAALEQNLLLRSREKNPRLFTTLGQIFLHGVELQEVEYVSVAGETPGTWLVSPDGSEIWVHFPEEAGKDRLRRVEISTRYTVFSPLQRGLGHITLRDLVVEHGCNYFPTWGPDAWCQAGLVSTRSGHHWTIQGCTIRHAKAVGIDCGSESGGGKAEGGSPRLHREYSNLSDTTAGYHLIENNDISDNGLCGICGIGHRSTRLLHNRIERNNAHGHPSPWWEFGGVKFHFCFDAVIEGNIIRDNEAHGIWLDNQFQGTRITRNLIVNNLWSGINLEYGRGPCLVDNNVIALTRHGDGIYGHDTSEMTIVHNLLYGNAGFGVWLAYCTSRVKVGDACSDHRILNNMILGNHAGAVSLALPWTGAQNNVSDNNLLMGSGQTLDEGSGPFPPWFQINNKSHCAQFADICPGPEAQTAENVIRNIQQAMDAAAVPQGLRPSPELLERGYLVPLEVWRAVLGNDRGSRVIRATRDALHTRQPVFSFPFDGTEREVPCAPVSGVERDFHGRALPENPLPGPFQHLEPGINRIPLIPQK